MTPLAVLALVTLGIGLALSITLVAGMRSLPSVDDAPAGAPRDGWPRVTAVVPARNEVRAVARAMTSLLDQDYPDLEVVAVDDRSLDGTGEVLDRLAVRRDRLRVARVDALPPGWLGKNHALRVGSDLASGELLLFTDADVVMAPDAVRKAVRLLEDRGVDHLAAVPRISVGGPWAMMTVAVFLVAFNALFRPWRASDPESSAFIGVGAFNLVRTTAYRAIGGHEAIALRPDDDVRLGRALKAAGFRQLAASARDRLSVEWYPSLGALARGLRKNAFAAVDYRIAPVVAGTAAALVVVGWPVAALFLTTGVTWWLNAATVAVGGLTTARLARGGGLPTWTGLAYPVGSALFLGVVWAAVGRVLITGRVEWRGREYPLAELRRGVRTSGSEQE